MEIKKISARLKFGWFGMYALAGIIALFFETGILSRGSVTEDKTAYIMQIVGILLALAMIPISLKGFKRMIDRFDEKEYSDNRILHIYEICSWLRLIAFLVVIAGGTILYYILDDTIGLYMAGIGALCSLFCFPSLGAVKNDTGF
jgi:O-antigen/teichoic acid export membrane protein